MTNATYHGIVEVECVTCGIKTNDVSVMEILNDVDMICDLCQTRNRKWTLVDGSVFITRETAKDSDEFEKIELGVPKCDICNEDDEIMTESDKLIYRRNYAGIDFYNEICISCWNREKDVR